MLAALTALLVWIGVYPTPYADPPPHKHGYWHSFCHFIVDEQNIKPLERPPVARTCWCILRLASGVGLG